MPNRFVWYITNSKSYFIANPNPTRLAPSPFSNTTRISSCFLLLTMGSMEDPSEYDFANDTNILISAITNLTLQSPNYENYDNYTEISFNQTEISSTPDYEIFLTKIEIWFQIILFYCIICGISCILHFLIALSIYRIQTLHSRFYTFMFFISIGRSAYALGRFINFIHRILRTLGLIPTVTSKLVCHSVHSVVLATVTIDLVFLLILVTDLIVSFLYPMLYRNLTVRQAVQISILAYLGYILFRFLPSYAEISYYEMSPCIDMYSVVTSAYATYARWSDFLLSLMIVFVYIVLWMAVRYRMNKKTQSTGNQATAKLSLKVIPFIRLQLIVHCLLVVTSRTLQFIPDFVDWGSLKQRLQAYNTEIFCINVAANAIIFYWRHPKLWHASLKMLCGEKLAAILGPKLGLSTGHQSERMGTKSMPARTVTVMPATTMTRITRQTTLRGTELA